MNPTKLQKDFQKKQKFQSTWTTIKLLIYKTIACVTSIADLKAGMVHITMVHIAIGKKNQIVFCTSNYLHIVFNGSIGQKKGQIKGEKAMPKL